MSSKSYLDDLRDISLARIATWEQYGVDAIEADLKNNDGKRYVGGPSEVREQARRWVNAVRAAEAEPKVPLLGLPGAVRNWPQAGSLTGLVSRPLSRLKRTFLQWFK